MTFEDLGVGDEVVVYGGHRPAVVAPVARVGTRLLYVELRPGRWTGFYRTTGQERNGGPYRIERPDAYAEILERVEVVEELRRLGFRYQPDGPAYPTAVLRAVSDTLRAALPEPKEEAP